MTTPKRALDDDAHIPLPPKHVMNSYTLVLLIRVEKKFKDPYVVCIAYKRDDDKHNSYLKYICQCLFERIFHTDEDGGND